MMEPPWRLAPAVEVLTRRRLIGRVERMRHRLAIFAIGIDARKGRDPVLRGSVRSTRARPPQGDRPLKRRIWGGCLPAIGFKVTPNAPPPFCPA